MPHYREGSVYSEILSLSTPTKEPRLDLQVDHQKTRLLQWDRQYVKQVAAKKLIGLFEFPCHTAPAEAEAECVFLQQEGIVDAVLSEDVDVFMFGCTMTLCKWKIETTGKTSSVYVNVIRGTELDRESMILCAVMSGGDYLPAGISKCGIKTVLEAVNVGLGRDLYQLCKIDKDGIKEWRDRLARELLINTSNFFTQKHKTLSVFYKFPDMTVLELYRHPFVFTAEAIAATNIN